MRTIRRALTTAAVAAGLAVGGGVVAAAPAYAAATAACGAYVNTRVVETTSTVYGVGRYSCPGNITTGRIQLRERRGNQWITVASATCKSPASGRECTAITPRVTKRPGSTYEVYAPAGWWTTL